MSAALSGEEVMRWNSFIHSDSSGLASGRKSVVQSCRKAGLSRPQPRRMSVSMALNCSVIMLPGGGHPRANAPTRMSLADPLWMASCIGRADRSALATSQQRELVEANG